MSFTKLEKNSLCESKEEGGNGRCGEFTKLPLFFILNILNLKVI